MMSGNTSRFSAATSVSNATTYCLRWNTFTTHLKKGIQRLLEEEELKDVTVACDGKFVKAHRVILSLCSPFFSRLFKANDVGGGPTIVILNNVRFKELESILQFVYLGEVNVEQEDLNEFLKVADLLQIEGLVEFDTDDGDRIVEEPPIISPTPSLPVLQPAPVVSVRNLVQSTKSYEVNKSHGANSFQGPQLKKVRMSNNIESSSSSRLQAILTGQTFVGNQLANGNTCVDSAGSVSESDNENLQVYHDQVQDIYGVVTKEESPDIVVVDEDGNYSEGEQSKEDDMEQNGNYMDGDMEHHGNSNFVDRDMEHGNFIHEDNGIIDYSQDLSDESVTQQKLPKSVNSVSKKKRMGSRMIRRSEIKSFKAGSKSSSKLRPCPYCAETLYRTPTFGKNSGTFNQMPEIVPLDENGRPLRKEPPVIIMTTSKPHSHSYPSVNNMEDNIFEHKRLDFAILGHQASPPLSGVGMEDRNQMTQGTTYWNNREKGTGCATEQSVQCPYCFKHYKNRSSLKVHKSVYHRKGSLGVSITNTNAGG